MALGALTVRIGIDAAEFTQGLTRAEANAQRFRRNLEAQTESARRVALGVAGIAAAAVGAFAVVDRLAKSAGDFADQAERMGTSAQNLASIAVAAATADTALSDIESTSVKITKAIAGIGEESKTTTRALSLIGLTSAELRKSDPVDVLEQMAKALARFRDGPEKVAVLEGIAKGASSLLPFLKELSEEGSRQVILTEAQIQRADAYADAQKRAATQLKLYAQAAATEALPAVTAFTLALGDTVKQLTSAGRESTALAANNGVRTFAEDGVKAIGVLVDYADVLARSFVVVGSTAAAGSAQIASVAQGEFRRALEIGREWQRDMQALINRPLFTDNLAKRLEELRKTPTGLPDLRPKLPTGGLPGLDSARRQVDELAQALRRARDVEFADSLRLDPGTVADVEKLLAAFDKFKVPTVERESILNRRLGADPNIRREQDEINRRTEESFELTRRAIQGATEFARRVEDEAGAIGLAGEALARFNVELERRRTIAGLSDQDVIASINRQFADIANQAAATVRNAQSADASARGVESGKALVAQYQQQIDMLGRTTLEQERYRISLEKAAALVNVTNETERARIATLYDTASALAGVLDAQSQYINDAIRLNEDFRSSFSENVLAFVEGEKSFRDSLNAMARDWEKALNRMAMRKLEDALFGTRATNGGALGGIFDWIAGLFNGGGSSQANWGAGPNPNWGLGVRALGGPVTAGRPYLVGERGMELFVPKVSGEIISNTNMRRMSGDTNNYSVTVNVPSGTQTASAQQIAAAVSLKLQRASARNH